MSGYDPGAWGRAPDAFGGEGGWDEPYRANLAGWIVAAAPASVLDVGCLDGALGRELRRRGYRGPYAGVDITPAFVARARRLAPAERFVVGDARALDPGLRAAAVVLANVIMHLDRPEDAVRACAAAAAERLFISTYSADPEIDEPGHGFLNRWLAPATVAGYLPPGWAVVRADLFRPTWTPDPRRRVYQLEARRC